LSDINRVILVGRLTRDAELKYTGSGVAVCKIGLAVNRRKKSGDSWTEEPSFFDVVLWGRLGEAISQYLVKGKQIAVEGELRQNRWEQDGQPRSKVEVHASNVQLLGGTSGGGQNRQSQPGTQQGGQYSQQGGGSYNGNNGFPGGDSGDSDFEDDIPF